MSLKTRFNAVLYVTEAFCILVELVEMCINKDLVLNSSRSEHRWAVDLGSLHCIDYTVLVSKIKQEKKLVVLLKIFASSIIYHYKDRTCMETSANVIHSLVFNRSLH